MGKKLNKAFKDVQPGDLIEVIWGDASIGKSLDSGPLSIFLCTVGAFLSAS